MYSTYSTEDKLWLNLGCSCSSSLDTFWGIWIDLERKFENNNKIIMVIVHSLFYWLLISRTDLIPVLYNLLAGIFEFGILPVTWLMEHIPIQP